MPSKQKNQVMPESGEVFGPAIQIGRFTISPPHSDFVFHAGKPLVHIEKDDGEFGTFDLETFEKAISDYFKKEF